jgi:transcriptional regulator with XRE-family HTH domain
MTRSDTFNHHLVERLRRVRETFALSEDQAARAAGVTVRTWRRWEGGGTMTTSTRPLYRLCVTLGISLGWLTTGKGKMRHAWPKPEVY